MEGSDGLLIGTDRFSNCKACGKKVSIRLRSCPHCREPDPQLRNSLGWRVNYTKALDPSVSSRKKSIWPFQTRIIKRLTIYSLIAIVVLTLAIDYFMPELLSLPDESANGWLGILYVAIYVAIAICVAAALKGEN